jgi:hypothetical protein
MSYIIHRVHKEYLTLLLLFIVLFMDFIHK